jgi:hypothetical protein
MHQLMQHNLAPRDGDSLACFVFLLYDVIDGPHYIPAFAAPLKGDLSFVVGFYVRHGPGAGNFSGIKILDKKALFRIGPEGAAEKPCCSQTV